MGLRGVAHAFWMQRLAVRHLQLADHWQGRGLLVSAQHFSMKQFSASYAHFCAQKRFDHTRGLFGEERAMYGLRQTKLVPLN